MKLPVIPFSNHDRFYDSSMAGNGCVEHTSSWLTINPYKGCPLGCTYCFRVRWGASDVPIAQYDVETAVEELISHPLFVPHTTPVSINVSSTDALLPVVERTTFRAIELLERKKLANPFGIVTKLPFSDSQVRVLSQLVYVRPIVFVSLAFLPSQIEPVPIKPRIRNLKRLSVARIPTVLYFRPIVPGWNDSEEKIRRILGLAESYCRAICIGGLRLSEEIERNLAKAGLPLPNSYNLDFHSKPLPNDVEGRVFDLYNRLNLRVPLFKHTSCAVSHILGWRNYNALYLDPQQNCVSTCPESQQLKCNHG